jgi:hypothetical protein
VFFLHLTLFRCRDTEVTINDFLLIFYNNTRAVPPPHLKDRNYATELHLAHCIDPC